ncbi:kin of IRRE-like protein 1 [Eriocheir sinensis]|uniref:kin of IRRE-like protein 1 n=1 Tax=Eriocheir sinensis TaxID=95602 RepID=UPI0021C9746C|nr:kin of IRRE-like protein 1 [Eriocheir sinensis]
MEETTEGGGGGGGGGRTNNEDGGGEVAVVVSRSERQVLPREDLGAGEREEPRITWGHANTNTAFFREDAPTNVTAIVGHKASLPCHVVNLGKKEVSWIRQRDLHILTVGIYTYTSDDRFKVYHPEKSDQWYLEISSVTFRDAGVYECQVSASPKISLPIMLSVEVQQARIEGPAEVYIQKGSTIRLTCRVNTHSENVGAVTWFRDTHRLDYDSPRGGVSVEIEKTPSRTTSKLFITRAMRTDVGNYTCVPQFADAASVQVHVVNGEESAAVHTAGSPSARSDGRAVCVLLMLAMMLSRR